MWATAHSKATVVIAVVPTVLILLCIASMEVDLAMVFKMSRSKMFWSNTEQNVILSPVIYDPLINISGLIARLPAFLSIFLALATIAKLSRNQQQIRRGYSMVTILLLAVGNLAWTLRWLVEITVGEKYVSNKTVGSVKSAAFLVFFSFVMEPSVIALYNPLVLCVRSSEIRAVLRNLFGHLGIYRSVTEYERFTTTD